VDAQSRLQSPPHTTTMLRMKQVIEALKVARGYVTGAAA
jgi:hypothetical protein